MSNKKTAVTALTTSTDSFDKTLNAIVQCRAQLATLLGTRESELAALVEDRQSLQSAVTTASKGSAAAAMRDHGATARARAHCARRRRAFDWGSKPLVGACTDPRSMTARASACSDRGDDVSSSSRSRTALSRLLAQIAP
jgi:hypothetical protein